LNLSSRFNWKILSWRGGLYDFTDKLWPLPNSCTFCILSFGMIEEPFIKRKLLPRADLPSLIEDSESAEILLLLGSRQSGKTSLMLLLLNYFLQEKKVPPEQVFFFDLEDINRVKELNSYSETGFDNFSEYLKEKGANLSQKIFIFIDEIQYLKHPSSFLKYLFDHYRFKFIVSGSSSLEIRKKFTDRLTGRAHRYQVRPLSFTEYLAFTKHNLLADKKKNVSLIGHFERGERLRGENFRFHATELTQLFEDFVLFGGYPRAALAETEGERYKILGDIYNLYVRKDIKDLARIDDPEAFNKLVTLLGLQVGSLVNEDSLSTETQTTRMTLRRYLFLLENTFVVKLISPYFRNPRKEIVKMPKVFFEDTGLRNFTINNFSPLNQRTDSGSLVENAAYNQLAKSLSFYKEMHFWRTKHGSEVDFVIEQEPEGPVPIEIKYQTFSKPQIPSGLRAFVKDYQPQKGFVVTKEFWATQKLGKTEIFWLPAWAV